MNARRSDLLDRVRAARESFERAATLPRTVAPPAWAAPLLEWMGLVEEDLSDQRDGESLAGRLDELEDRLAVAVQRIEALEQRFPEDR